MPFLSRTALVLLGVFVIAIPSFADPTVATSTAPSSGGGFDTAPRKVEARVQYVDTDHRKLFLIEPQGPPIEMSVPAAVPIQSARGDDLQLKDLQPGTSVQVRYHPLTVEAIEIKRLNS